jgi:hypothetical protein
MIEGRAFIVEQTAPAAGLITTISVPADLDAKPTQLLVSLASEVPVTGMPIAMPAIIPNIDKDEDGIGDVDQLVVPGQDIVLSFEDVGLTGDYHVVAALYVQGGGLFQPEPGIDYLGASEKLTFGDGPVAANIRLDVYEE